MKRRRHTPEQIVRKLREVERLLGEGQTIAEAAKQVEISEQTYHRWRNQYGGMKADDAKRLRELERENARLKRIVADKELEIDALRTALHAFSRGHPRWGYRRAWATLREEGWGVNRKRVQRLWREEGLRVPLKRRKRQRLGDSAQPARRLRAERPNHVWALDFQFDQTADGRVLKLLNIVDEHTREALAMVAARRINADATASTLDRIVAGRGTAPGYIRCDNGPELTANALRDWCRFSGTGSSYIEPGAPWENPYVESFNGRLRRRVHGRRAVRQPARGAGADRGLADRVQHEAPAQQPGLARPGCLRRALGGSATRWTLISGGLAKGVRSRHLIPKQTGLRRNLEGYLHYYNADRAPSGRRTRGRTPESVIGKVKVWS